VHVRADAEQRKECDVSLEPEQGSRQRAAGRRGRDHALRDAAVGAEVSAELSLRPPD